MRWQGLTRFVALVSRDAPCLQFLMVFSRPMPALCQPRVATTPVLLPASAHPAPRLFPVQSPLLSHPSCHLPHQGFAATTVRHTSTTTRLAPHAAVSDASEASTDSQAPAQGGAAAAIQLPQYCCGCGVKMQQHDPTAPGYFIIPARLTEPPPEANADVTAVNGINLEEQSDYADALKQETALKEEFEDARDQQALPEVTCQRCHSLKHAGKVKVDVAEALLPEFDLSKKVGRKIALQKDRRAVVLLVVDATDFDGSMPRAALQSLYPPGYSWETAQRETDEMGAPLPPPVRFQLMVALNKVDLLPKEATVKRLTQWVRTRMNTAGLPRPDKVFCVSANKGTGIRDMMEDIKTALGFRGDLWVVGSQNAGKSSVIAALKRLGGTAGQRDPTIAAVAGTTLGLINVPGLPLGPKHRAFDTPGVPQPHQLTAFLSMEEVKQVLPRKSLIGRTFRTSTGHSVLLGGLARIDILDHAGATLYLTAFVSPYVNLHLGKIDGADERVRTLLGGQLAPPASLERWEELPAWVPRDVQVEGTAWDKSTVDVHIAGLGWVAIGVKGSAKFRVWVAGPVAVTTRPALVPDYAKEFCRPGFNVMLQGATSGKQQQQQQLPGAGGPRGGGARRPMVGKR